MQCQCTTAQAAGPGVQPTRPRRSCAADAASGGDHRTSSVLLIGLGNPLITDDSVGLRVVERLRARFAGNKQLDIVEDYWGGLRLMERMVGYRHVVVVDAICTGAPAGTIHHLTVDSMATQRSASAHDVNLATALQFGRMAGAALPPNEQIRIVAIEAEDVINFGSECTPAVAAAIPRAVAEVGRVLQLLFPL